MIAMTDEALAVADKPKRISPMHDPEVRAKAAATRARHKAEKESRLASKERKEEKQEVKQQTAAVKARWAGEKATEEDVRKFFAKDVGVEEGLQLLARMRKNCEIASYALNQRITADDNQSRCKTCGGPKKANKQWALVRPHRNPVTQLVENDYFCQIACVALENQKTQGVKGVSDRGMLNADNPENHPNTRAKTAV
jgi:hypothetical protein